MAFRIIRRFGFALSLGIFLLACGSSNSSKLEIRDGLYVLHLKGSPREMGLAHGRLLKEMLPEVKTYIQQIAPYLFQNYLRQEGIIAKIEGYVGPDILEEIQGITDGSEGAIGYEDLLLLNSPLYILYNFGNLFGLVGCSSFAAFGEATADGRLLVGRNLDWSAMSFSQKYPVVLIYEPKGKTAFVSFGYPGIVGVLTGMNSYGVMAAIHVDLSTELSLDGVDILFGLRRVMEEAKNLAEAEQILINLPRSTGGNVVLASAGDVNASVFEFSTLHYALRRPENGIIWETNNYQDPVMQTYEAAAVAGSSWRYQRLGDLLNLNYGQLNPDKAVAMLRDTYDLKTQTTLPILAENGRTLGNNSNMYSVVFLPQDLRFWAAMGPTPGLTNTYVGFDLRKETDPGYKPATPISNYPAE
jgi:predicted choloylglycine hydrolase